MIEYKRTRDEQGRVTGGTLEIDWVSFLLLLAIAGVVVRGCWLGR